MFPYPSGAGLHVVTHLVTSLVTFFRVTKSLRGFNVLHPMGYDAYGLPAEQYAIQTGQHPEITTNENIAAIASNSIRLVSAMTGTVRCAPVIPSITSGHSGLS